jgi:hypothetical protein
MYFDQKKKDGQIKAREDQQAREYIILVHMTFTCILWLDFSTIITQLS